MEAMKATTIMLAAKNTARIAARVAAAMPAKAPTTHERPRQSERLGLKRPDKAFMDNSRYRFMAVWMDSWSLTPPRQPPRNEY
jgi:hypothetical protein